MAEKATCFRFPFGISNTWLRISTSSTLKKNPRESYEVHVCQKTLEWLLRNLHINDKSWNINWCKLYVTQSLKSLNCHSDIRMRLWACSRNPVLAVPASRSSSCFLIQGGSSCRIHKDSFVSLCLKSGPLGYFLSFLLSHHSCGFARNICHKRKRSLLSVTSSPKKIQ